MLRWLPLFVYVGSIFMANWFIQNVGTQYFPGGPHVIPVGFGLEAPSGVLWVGMALVARDLVQQFWGARVAWIAVAVGAFLSYFVAPSLALASGVAFLVSETADLLVYTPVMRRGYVSTGVLLSGVVGTFVDTFVFLMLAFGSLQYWEGQVVGKLEVTVAAAVVIWLIRRRVPRAIPAYAPRTEAELAMRSVVLLSGGIDSTTCLALALTDAAPDDVLAISMAYGQKHHAELDSAREVATHYGVRHEVLDIPTLFRGGGSTLIEGGAENPSVSYEEVQPEGVSPAYVPFRNGVFLSMATATALVHDAQVVYFGAHSEDAARWAYPDCTPEFIGSLASAIFVGSYMKVRLLTPLQWLSKAQVVRLGTEVGAPYHLTMSCYNGTRPACGTCPTCRSRWDAFRANGLDDPIDYAEDS